MKYLIALLIIASLLLAGCGGNNPTTMPPPETTQPTTTTPTIPNTPTVEPPIKISEPPPTVELEPVTIGEWAGTGMKTTEPFTINYAPWGIRWRHEPKLIDGESMGLFQIYVYTIEEPDIPITLAANVMEAGEDESWVYETGTFFLTINAANTNWGVLVGAMDKP